MKLKLPIEHLIQQKAEQYDDIDLLRCALDVDDLKREIADLKRTHARVGHTCQIIIWVSVAVIACSMFARWGH